MTESNDTDAKSSTFTPRAKGLFALCLVATVALTAFDLWTKDWALANLSADPIGEPPAVCEADERGYTYAQRSATEPMTVVEGNLELRYAENCGAAFGMLRSAPSWVRHGVFGLAAVAATIALLWMFYAGRGGVPFAWAVPFIVSGAIGNLADRVRLGYVVDFIRFYWQDPLPLLGTQWPTFNVADITISIGVGLLLIDGFLEGRREKAAKAETEAADAEASPA
ncbi:MAG: signal peptidase II [Myxococcota bacterium]